MTRPTAMTKRPTAISGRALSQAMAITTKPMMIASKAAIRELPAPTILPKKGKKLAKMRKG